MILNFSIILFIQFSIISPWLNARKHLQSSHPIPSETLAEISDTDAIHLKLGTLIL